VAAMIYNKPVFHSLQLNSVSDGVRLCVQHQSQRVEMAGAF
jgi:hypothetical protein